MTPEIRKIGIVIRNARRRRRLTQEKLAEIAEITARSISDLENGKRKPRVENLERLLKALNIPNDLLFRQQKDKFQSETERFVNAFMTASMNEQQLIMSAVYAILDTVRLIADTERLERESAEAEKADAEKAAPDAVIPVVRDAG